MNELARRFFDDVDALCHIFKSPAFRILCTIAEEQSLHISKLCRLTGLNSSSIGPYLTMLEKAGWIKNTPMGSVRMISFIPKEIAIRIRRGSGLKIEVEYLSGENNS